MKTIDFWGNFHRILLHWLSSTLHISISTETKVIMGTFSGISLYQRLPNGIAYPQMTSHIIRITDWTNDHVLPLPKPTRKTRTPAFWDTPCRPMITHTSDSHQIPSKSKTKLKLQILKKCQKFKFWNLARNFTRYTTHLLKLLNKMCKYQMDPIRTVGATERTRDAGQTDGQTDGVKPIYPPNNFIAGV